MLNPSDSAQNIKRYLKKLLRLIEHDAVFSLFKCTLVNKNKVDDIICCVEGSFPNEYKDYVKKMGPKGLRTYGLWIQILKDIKNPFCLSSSLYSVQKASAIQGLSSMIAKIDSDINQIYNNASSMF